MRLWKSWLLAKKDITILKKRKSLMGGMVAFPLVIGIGLPAVVDYLFNKKSIPVSEAGNLLGAFGFFFIIFAVFLPLYVSSYSIVGEKVEKSIEPLLATPTSDEEILIGKYISSFIPNILSIYLGTFIFMSLVDIFTFSKFNYYYYPNWTFVIVLVLSIPLAIMYSISFSVFVSSKVNSTQTAYQLGALSMIPFLVLYVMGEIGLVNLNSENNILVISAALLAMAVAMFFLSRATFNREKILTQWK